MPLLESDRLYKISCRRRKLTLSNPNTIQELIEAGADSNPAITGIDRPSLLYADLRRQVGQTVATLNGLGIGRNDRVAIVLPNGPDMAAAFVCLAACTTTAPLNPAYTRDEYEFYLADLGARALLVEKGSDSPAADAARSLGIEVLFLEVADGAPAGAFTIKASRNGDVLAAALTGLAGPDDIALILHTSGTTSRPKIVPLSQKNLCASAANIRETLDLGSDDICLNIMPLFHIHGLMAAILATLASGASVCCTPRFNAHRFFRWFTAVQPTWYTAVPTMHQAILMVGSGKGHALEGTQLRFIRSSSSSLPPQVLTELEDMFEVPVVEAYAMTEAAHQMTSNQLPPGIRKPGTAGCAAGPEVAIMSETESALLTQGETGEVVIRGPNVTAGYENNAAANKDAFVDGWFRTGDQGAMDEDGYLTITGRLKEIINRGGEKISPREVDDVLMDHPAVRQVVTFAMPHKMLGEEVAAAVVLKDEQAADEAGIRTFAGERLAGFKVPRKVLIVDEIPKGATGKLQRIGLAEKLGLGK